MCELEKIGKEFTSKFVRTGPSSYKKRIYRAAVSQSLRNTSLKGPIQPKGPHTLQVKLCKKAARKTELNVLWHSTGFPSGFSVFLSVLCVFLCV